MNPFLTLQTHSFEQLSCPAKRNLPLQESKLASWMLPITCPSHRILSSPLTSGRRLLGQFSSPLLFQTFHA